MGERQPVAIPIRPRDRIPYQVYGEPLSPRERKIVALTARGLSQPQIGLRLGSSYETVKNHTEHARAKLGAMDMQEAVAIAVVRGEINPAGIRVGKVNIETLTTRQRAILDASTENFGLLTYAEIGHQFGISERTVKGTMAVALRKAGIRGRREAVLARIRDFQLPSPA